MDKSLPDGSSPNQIRNRCFYLIGALIFVFACNLTQQAPTEAPPGPGNPSTAAALTVQDQLTKGAGISEPTSTQTPSAIAEATTTPEPAETGETPAPIEPGSCGDSLPTRLSIETEATVVVFQVTLRTEPGLNAEQVNFLARDRVVQLLEGPECVDGSWWWRVNSEDLDLSGWVVEGDDENYYLDP